MVLENKIQIQGEMGGVELVKHDLKHKFLSLNNHYKIIKKKQGEDIY